MIGAPRRAARAASGEASSEAVYSGVTFSRYGLRLTWITGAVAHEPRHSTSTIAKRPSAAAVHDLIPSRRSSSRTTPRAPRRQQGRLVQTWKTAWARGRL